MSTSHQELQEALGAYVLDQLDADLCLEVRDHLDTCSECRSHHAEISPLADALRGVDADLIHAVGVVPPAELDERIRRALPRS
jgi:anti-sigma factor RsiW